MLVRSRDEDDAIIQTSYHTTQVKPCQGQPHCSRLSKPRNADADVVCARSSRPRQQRQAVRSDCRGVVAYLDARSSPKLHQAKTSVGKVRAMPPTSAHIYLSLIDKRIRNLYPVGPVLTKVVPPGVESQLTGIWIASGQGTKFMHGCYSIAFASRFSLQESNLSGRFIYFCFLESDKSEYCCMIEKWKVVTETEGVAKCWVLSVLVHHLEKPTTRARNLAAAAVWAHRGHICTPSIPHSRSHAHTEMAEMDVGCSVYVKHTRASSNCCYGLIRGTQTHSHWLV